MRCAAPALAAQGAYDTPAGKNTRTHSATNKSCCDLRRLAAVAFGRGRDREHAG